MLSPTVLNNLHSTEAIPLSTEAIPHCTEQPPQYWSNPPDVLNNLHSIEPTLCGVIKLSNQERKAAGTFA